MRIIYDTATGQFSFDDSDVRPTGANITAWIERHGQVIPFQGLEFGVTVTQADGASEAFKFPAPGVVYLSTDQDMLENVPIKLAPGDEVTLDVWITNGGVTTTGQHSLTVPRPAQPYPSWTWDGARWVAPVSYPDDGGVYDWDEAAQAWVAI